MDHLCDSQCLLSDHTLSLMARLLDRDTVFFLPHSKFCAFVFSFSFFLTFCVCLFCIFVFSFIFLTFYFLHFSP